MDFLTKKEAEGLINDIKAKEIAIEADKYSFEMKLKNGLGEQMLEKLTNPDKPSRILKFKIKYYRWRNRQREMKELRLLNKMRKLENIEE